MAYWGTRHGAWDGATFDAHADAKRFNALVEVYGHQWPPADVLEHERPADAGAAAAALFLADASIGSRRLGVSPGHRWYRRAIREWPC